MEDHLIRLLETEARARALIDTAIADRQRTLDEALATARDADARFAANRAQLHAPFVAEAQERAAQAVAELTRKYAERQRNLREMASRHEQEAVDAAMNLLLDPNG